MAEKGTEDRESERRKLVLYYYTMTVLVWKSCRSGESCILFGQCRCLVSKINAKESSCNCWWVGDCEKHEAPADPALLCSSDRVIGDINKHLLLQPSSCSVPTVGSNLAAPLVPGPGSPVILH